MIGVVVPAHNEEALIGACLTSLLACASDPALAGEDVRIIVALDRCWDRTGEIARSLGAHCVELTAGNVGMARSSGFDAALGAGARWIASTDADSTVPANWLSRQLSYGTDAFCGIVRVEDWSEYPGVVREEFLRTECHTPGHRHVHGANLGVSATSYRLSGGFQPLPAHEDVALLAALEAVGASVAREVDPPVITSARHEARAVGGFSDYLRSLEQRLMATATGALAGPSILPEAPHGI